MRGTILHPSRSTPHVCISQLFDGLIRLDVLIEPQHIPGIVLFLDLHQSSVVRPVRRPHKLLARFTQLIDVVQTVATCRAVPWPTAPPSPCLPERSRYPQCPPRSPGVIGRSEADRNLDHVGRSGGHAGANDIPARNRIDRTCLGVRGHNLSSRGGVVLSHSYFALSLSPIRDNLAEGSRAHAGNAWRRVGSKLVVLELATAVVLLVGAGLHGKSLYLLLHVDIGMRADHLATLSLDAPTSNYGKDPQAIALERRVISQIAALPGVKSVGITTDIPVSHWGDTTWVRVLGRPWHGEHYDVPERDVNPDYFTTLGAKLFRGRYFVEADEASKPHVAIINQAFAKQYFPGEDPLGKQLSTLGDKPVSIEIVGIVKDIKEVQLDTVNRSVVYIPFGQNPNSYFIVVV